VPLNAAAEHFEMVFKIASLLTILVMGKKFLGAEESARKVFVDQNIF
jgi:hypothetical protein